MRAVPNPFALNLLRSHASSSKTFAPNHAFALKLRQFANIAIPMAMVITAMLQNIPMRLSAIALAALLSLAALTAAACAQQPAPAPQTEPATAAPASAPAVAAPTAAAPTQPQPAAADPVTIGTVLDYTGDLSDFGPDMRSAIDMSARIINDAGGLLGSPLTLVHKDGATNPQVSTDAARALVNVDGAEIIIGPVSSGSTLAVANAVTIPTNTLHISPAATSPAMTILEDNDFVFRVRVSDSIQGVILARLARELGYDKAAAIYINNAYGDGLANIFKDNFEQEGGTLTAMVPQESGQPSYLSEIATAVEDDPDVLVAVTYPESTEVFLREAIEGDYINTFLFVSAVRSQSMVDAVGGDLLEGTYGTAPGTPESDATRTFLSLYEAEYGTSVDIPLVGEAFDAFTIAALAVEKAGVYEGAAVRDALRSITNPPGIKIGPGEIPKALDLIRSGEDIDYEGVTGSQNFDEHGDVINAIEIWQIRNGIITPTGRFETP